MKSTVENLSPTRVRLAVEVPFEELADNVAAAYKKIGSQIRIPGFRPGKVPARIIDQRVGRGAVLEEANRPVTQSKCLPEDPKLNSCDAVFRRVANCCSNMRSFEPSRSKSMNPNSWLYRV